MNRTVYIPKKIYVICNELWNGVPWGFSGQPTGTSVVNYITIIIYNDEEGHTPLHLFTE
jgi:hypothetical protein